MIKKAPKTLHYEHATFWLKMAVPSILGLQNAAISPWPPSPWSADRTRPPWLKFLGWAASFWVWVVEELWNSTGQRGCLGPSSLALYPLQVWLPVTMPSRRTSAVELTCGWLIKTRRRCWILSASTLTILVTTVRGWVSCWSLCPQDALLHWPSEILQWRACWMRPKKPSKIF